jgi:hypothetical protein
MAERQSFFPVVSHAVFVWTTSCLRFSTILIDNFCLPCDRLFRALARLSFPWDTSNCAASGKTKQLCPEGLMWGQAVYTFESCYNSHLVEMGAIPTETFVEFISQFSRTR